MRFYRLLWKILTISCGRPLYAMRLVIQRVKIGIGAISPKNPYIVYCHWYIIVYYDNK